MRERREGENAIEMPYCPFDARHANFAVLLLLGAIKIEVTRRGDRNEMKTSFSYTYI